MIRKGDKATLGKCDTGAKILADRCANQRHKVWLGAWRSETYRRFQTTVGGRDEEGNEGWGISKEDEWDEENERTGAPLTGVTVINKQVINI